MKAGAAVHGTPDMKILAINFLRLGDLALSARALRSLRSLRPGASLALAMHRACTPLAPLMPYVDRVYPLDREDLQTSLGEAGRPMFDAYASLRAYVDALAAERFDLAVNFSQTLFAGRVAGLAGARRTLGLRIDEAGSARIESPWFDLMNKQAGRVSSDVVHYGQIFARAVGGELESLPPGLIETRRGREEAAALLAAPTAGRWIGVQCLTSDEKKNWGLERYEKALLLAAKARPFARVALFGAEFERERLAPLAAALRRAGIDARLAICSVEGLLSAVKQCRVVLTGDTSAKHVACDAGVACVEISVGSSDWRRTGAWSPSSSILQAPTECAPCPHSSACSRPRRDCADEISPEYVARSLIETFDRIGAERAPSLFAREASA